MQGILVTIAQILRESAQEMENLGTQLCEDPDVISRHIGALQAIDVIVQRNVGLAQVLENQCQQEQIEQVTLEALRDRLRLSPEMAGEASVW